MADTNIDSGFIPELLTDAVAGGFTGLKALFGTGAAVLRPGMPSGTIGEKINVPYFASLGEFDDVTTDGTDLTPAELTSAAEAATVAQAGKAFSLTDWAKSGTAGDPYAEAASQLVGGAMRKFDAALITAARATLSGMTVDVYNAGTPAYMSYDLLADGLAKLGDEATDLACVVVHSATAARMRKIVDLNGRPMFTDPINGGLGSVMGIPLLISDRLTTVSSKHTSLILKKNSLVCWYNGAPVVETQRNILSAKTLAAVHVFYAAHRYTRLPGLSKGGVAIMLHN